MSDLIRVGESRVGVRVSVELADVAADATRGSLLIVEQQNPSDGQVVFVVPSGQTLSGVSTLIVAVGERGWFALVADDEVLNSFTTNAPTSEPFVAEVPFVVEGGAKGTTLTVETTGWRGHLIVKGRLGEREHA